MNNTIIYITKYFLTKGIQKIEADVVKHPSSKNKKGIIAYVPIFNERTKKEDKMGYFNDEFFLTLEEAKLDAEKKKQLRIKTLENQIIKLKKLIF